jgi:hypothetical protein
MTLENNQSAPPTERKRLGRPPSLQGPARVTHFAAPVTLVGAAQAEADRRGVSYSAIVREALEQRFKVA